MTEIDLHKKFLDYLYSSYPSKKELTNLLENILQIERESISRRLRGKVLFSVEEMGKIANALNISIDSLLEKKANPISLPLNLLLPQYFDTEEDYYKLFEEDKKGLEKMGNISPLQIGHVFDTLPPEFYISYEYLSKFYYFKAMTVYNKTKYYETYSNWQVPPIINTYHKLIMRCFNNADSIFYIWDNTAIWILVKDILFSYKLGNLDKENMLLIKKDLHEMLNSIEMKAKTPRIDRKDKEKNIDLYISNTHITFSSAYIHSSTETLLQYKTPFPYSKLCKNTKEFDTLSNWMDSMKNLSTLISDSGAIERNIFFKEQHKIVDSVLAF